MRRPLCVDTTCWPSLVSSCFPKDERSSLSPKMSSIPCSFIVLDTGNAINIGKRLYAKTRLTLFVHSRVIARKQLRSGVEERNSLQRVNSFDISSKLCALTSVRRLKWKANGKPTNTKGSSSYDEDARR